MATFARLLRTLPRYAQLRRSQYWSDDELRAWQDARLGEVLSAAAKMPFYARRFGRDTPGARDFAQLPILRRRDIAELNRSVREQHRGEKLLTDWSSGSTGMPMEFIFDAGHQQGRFAARARYLRENGWNPLGRTAWLVRLNFMTDTSDDSKLAGHRLFKIGNSLPNIDAFDEQFEWLIKCNPRYIYSFPSNLEGILPFFEEQRVRLPTLRQIFTGAEVLDDTLRERVETTMGARIADNYGSTEAFLAWQCPRGSYHVNAEHVRIEIVGDDDAPVAAGVMGRVLATTLENQVMPLIRYEIGDYAVAASVSRCDCGRTLPMIGRVLGRGLNLFRASDGRLISPWPLVEPLKARPELRQFQLVQTALGSFLVRFTKAAAFEGEARSSVQSEFSRILGVPVSIDFQEVNEIQRSRAGKFMVALSELSD